MLSWGLSVELPCFSTTAWPLSGDFRVRLCNAYMDKWGGMSQAVASVVSIIML